MIDWNKFLIGEQDWTFLTEVLLRTFLMYFIILLGLRLLGKRGVRQLSVFEMVVIISLGSAAGDPMFYQEVGLVVPVVIFAVIVAAYRLTTFLMARSTVVDNLVEGRATYLIEDGEFSIENFSKETLAQDEFFAELRQQHISHLGQVKTAILETSGNISVFFFEDNAVKPGLPILPHLFEKAHRMITGPGTYACSFCGNVVDIKSEKTFYCPKCGHDHWVCALTDVRVT